MDNQEINSGRRRFLTLATCGAGGVAALGVATPFVASFFPSEKAKAAGAAVEIDVSKIESGQMLTAEWQGKPIWVVNRTNSSCFVDNQCDRFLFDIQIYPDAY